MDDELASPSRFFSMDGKPGGGKGERGGGGEAAIIERYLGN